MSTQPSSTDAPRPALYGLPCADVMERPACVIERYATCAEAIQAMAQSRSRYAAVASNGVLAGMVTIADFARLRGRDPADICVSAIMTHARDLTTLAPQTMVLDALRLLDEDGYHQLPVISGGRKLEGFITRETLMSLQPCRK